MHGYQLIQEIAERSNGSWRPSPGSVYPALSLLEDEGLVTIERIEGRRQVSLTETGRTYVAEHKDELDAVWNTATEDEDDLTVELREEGQQLFFAAMQVFQTGTEEQVRSARRVITDARRSLYRILAEDASDDDADAAADDDESDDADVDEVDEVDDDFVATADTEVIPDDIGGLGDTRDFDK
jgi:DNA-binding PadR family transcriptional regulator